MRKTLSLLVALIVLWCIPAQANGRFPRALRLMHNAQDTNFLAVYGTYGLLLSTNFGATWAHVCEAATGPYSGESPLLEVLPGGEIVLGTDSNLMHSVESPCDWQPLLTPGASEAVEDVTQSVAANGELLVLLSSLQPPNGYRSSLQRMAPATQQFSLLADLPSALIERALTVDVAPSDAERIYVTGINPQGVGVVLRTVNGGATFDAFEVPLTSSAAAPYLAAVHPTNPNQLFVRTDELSLENGVITANDRLLYSQDGGESWRVLFERHGKLLGVALSPDGQTLFLGYGDPVLFAYQVLAQDLGLYRIDLSQIAGDAGQSVSNGATDGGALHIAFEKLHNSSITCLRATPQTLFACFTQEQQGFEVGQAPIESALNDATLHFSPLLDLTQVRPLPCAMNSSTEQCASDTNFGWPAACFKLGAPCAWADAGAAADSGGNLPDGGPMGGPAADHESDSAFHKPQNGSCACRLTPNSEGRAELLLLGALLGALCCRRR